MITLHMITIGDLKTKVHKLQLWPFQQTARIANMSMIYAFTPPHGAQNLLHPYCIDFKPYKDMVSGVSLPMENRTNPLAFFGQKIGWGGEKKAVSNRIFFPPPPSFSRNSHAIFFFDFGTAHQTNPSSTCSAVSHMSCCEDHNLTRNLW